MVLLDLMRWRVWRVEDWDVLTVPGVCDESICIVEMFYRQMCDILVCFYSVASMDAFRVYCVTEVYSFRY